MGPIDIDPRSLSVLLFLGGVILPAAWLLIMEGAKRAPAGDVALLATVETVLGPLWAWIGLALAPSPAAIIGGFVVIAGVTINAVLAIREERRAKTASAAA